MTRSFDKKLEQLRLQQSIYEILNTDNGVSSHFDYHVNIMSDNETIKLNLLTFNKRHNEYMLFHTVFGTSSLDCLKKMLNYIKTDKVQQLNSYTIAWNRKGDDNKYNSYFQAISESDAKAKFLHEKNKGEYEFSVVLNPVS